MTSPGIVPATVPACSTVPQPNTCPCVTWNPDPFSKFFLIIYIELIAVMLACGRSDTLPHASCSSFLWVSLEAESVIFQQHFHLFHVWVIYTLDGQMKYGNDIIEVIFFSIFFVSLFSSFCVLCYFPQNRLCGVVVRVRGYITEMYCVCCEVRTEFIYVM
jgi:hypothetical protein